MADISKILRHLPDFQSPSPEHGNARSAAPELGVRVLLSLPLCHKRARTEVGFELANRRLFLQCHGEDVPKTPADFRGNQDK